MTTEALGFVLISVAGHHIRTGWPGSYVDGGEFANWISDHTLRHQVDNAVKLLISVGFAVNGLLRPEIVGQNSLPELQFSLSKVIGHIFVGHPSEFKYLKGVRNYLICVDSSYSARSDAAIRFDLEPKRLNRVDGFFNCSWFSELPNFDHLRPKLYFLPDKSVWFPIDSKSANLAESDDAIHDFFINPWDDENSAHVMLSRKVSAHDLITDITLRPPVPIIALVVEARREESADFGLLVRDLTFLASIGRRFSILIFVSDVSCLDLLSLQKISFLINSAVRDAKIPPSILDTAQIKICCKSPHFSSIIKLCDYILVSDQRWENSVIFQASLRNGVLPIFTFIPPRIWNDNIHEYGLIIDPRQSVQDALSDHDRFDSASLGRVLVDFVEEEGRLTDRQRLQNVGHYIDLVDVALTEMAKLLNEGQSHD